MPARRAHLLDRRAVLVLYNMSLTYINRARRSFEGRLIWGRNCRFGLSLFDRNRGVSYPMYLPRPSKNSMIRACCVRKKGGCSCISTRRASGT